MYAFYLKTYRRKSRELIICDRIVPHNRGKRLTFLNNGEVVGSVLVSQIEEVEHLN